MRHCPRQSRRKIGFILNETARFGLLRTYLVLFDTYRRVAYLLFVSSPTIRIESHYLIVLGVEG